MLIFWATNSNSPNVSTPWSPVAACQSGGPSSVLHCPPPFCSQSPNYQKTERLLFQTCHGEIRPGLPIWAGEARRWEERLGWCTRECQVWKKVKVKLCSTQLRDKCVWALWQTTRTENHKVSVCELTQDQQIDWFYMLFYKRTWQFCFNLTQLEPFKSS